MSIPRRLTTFRENKSCVIWLGIIKMQLSCLSEASSAAAHDLALADQLGVELGAIESEVDVEVDTIERALWGVHTLEVLLEVLSAEIGGECDNFLNACEVMSVYTRGIELRATYVDPWYTPGRRPHHKHKAHPRT